VLSVVDDRTREILRAHRGTTIVKRRGWLMRRMLLASDLAGFAVAFALTEAAVVATGAPVDRLDLLSESILFAVCLPLWIVAAKLSGLYVRDEECADYSGTDDLLGVFQLTTVGIWLVSVGTHVTQLAQPQFSKLAIFWALTVVAVPTLRALARARCRRSIHYLQNAVVLGAGEIGQQVARKLLKHPEYGINLVGFIDREPSESGPGLGHLRILGGLEDLPRLVEVLDVERVIVAFSNDDSEDVVGILRELNRLNVHVDVVPRFFEVLSPTIAVHGVEGMPLLGLRAPRLARSERFLKRCLDVLGSAAGLVVLSPVFAVLAAAIAIESGRPVFYRQVRMGAGDRTFRILKFRTMVRDADAQKQQLAHLNKHSGAGGDPRMFKIDDDPRVTRTGRFLRRLSLDELPQLWNVLRGEMSLVGPRPLILEEHAHVTDWAERRLDLRPGLTGMWQVLGRDSIPFSEMVRLDYLYVSGWSFAGDLRLILQTIPAVFGRRGR